MISFDDKTRQFHLSNDCLSLVLGLRPDSREGEELLFAYLGPPLRDPASCLYLTECAPGASFDTERQILPYACPTDGRGDYRPPMVCALDGQGQRCGALYFDSYRTEAGKRLPEGLPGAYAERPEEAESLYITLKDPANGLRAELCYTLFASRPAFAVSAQYINGGSEPLTLENAGSGCVTLPGRYELVHLHGAWARERAVERTAPAAMTRLIASCRGASGHEHNPFAALLSQDATEFSGECLGAALVYSGDFAIAVDENAYQSTRMTLGLNPRSFSWRLSPGEAFQAPEALFVWSDRGLNGMSQAFHSLLRQRVCRGYWRDRERPILINNWEATYFDFDEEKLLRIAQAAASAGIELFVLDDGWFGRRNSDACSLGDWTENRQKLPEGLKGLSRKIHEMGLRFGLWLEPEMVSLDSDLYRTHPDWCLQAEGRPRTTARNQLILDFTRQEVQDYIIQAVTNVLESAEIDYVKWDMNRNFLEAGSPTLSGGRQGETAHRYMLGLYRVLEDVTRRFPQTLFESCSGGGGRFDPGMLYYMPQTWTSDDTDAAQRLFIQYGTSLCYPVSAMGAHVSAVPNHQVGRVTSLKTRGDVALAGNFGYEMDLSRQTEEDLREIRRQTELIKRIRKTTQQGTFTRLLSPFEGNIAAWQFCDEQRIILCAYRLLNTPNPGPLRLRLRDVPPGAYRGEDGKTYQGQDLMCAGVPLRFSPEDFASLVIIWERL